MKIKRVLNIEDNTSKQFAIKRALNKNGVEIVETASTAEKGIKLIEQASVNNQSYDLLVTDMEFPVADIIRKNAGEYVISQLRQKGIDIPIVVCSSERLVKKHRDIDYIYYNERSGDIDGDIREIVRKYSKM